MPERLDIYHDASKWRGALFPLGKTGDPVSVGDDLQLVFDSILQILNTRRGERSHFPEFGSDLKALLWEPHDLFLQQESRSEILRALTQWEPRVLIEDIQFSATPEQIDRGLLYIQITAQLVNNPRGLTTFLVPISSQGTLFS